MADCYCYILECSDGSLYTGWTTDPDRRLREHEAGRGSSYTRARRPLRIVYLEAQPNQRSAMRRERAIKSRSRKYKLQLIADHPIAIETTGNEDIHDGQPGQDTLD